MSNWLTTSCDNCGDEISYHVDWDRVPNLCKDCIAEKRAERAKWHETTCDDCGDTIKYHEDWNRVPDLCKDCIADRKRKRAEAQAKWQETKCGDCGDTIKYHVDWNRIPDLCKDCIAERKRKREEAQAKWRETSCSRCHDTIKYNTDWNRVPDLCKDCLAKVREERAEREKERAKWHTKSCALCSNTIKYHEDWARVQDYCKSCNEWLTKPCEAQGCGNPIQYKKYWTNISDYCKPCKSGEHEVTERRPRPDGGWDEYTGKGYVNKNGVIVFTDDSWRGKHSHTVYNADGTQRGHRDEGHGKDFQRDDQSQTNCERCGDYFDYPSRWSNPPRYCKDCVEIITEERNQRYRKEPRLASHIEQGIDGEMAAESAAINQFGFEHTGYEPPNQGIDRIFRDGDGNIVIMEAKSVKGDGPSALHDTNSGKQMEEDWIRHHAEELAKSKSGTNSELGKEILDKLDNQEREGIRRIIVNKDPGSNQVTCYEAGDWDTNTWTEVDSYDG